MTAIDDDVSQQARRHPPERRRRSSRRSTRPPRSSRPTTCPGIDDLNKAVQALGRAFDPEWGGFGKAPKFPSTFNLELMLRAYMTDGGRRAEDHRRHDARRDGVRRDVRPHRRRLRPLLGRPRMARPALREDAVRPGPAVQDLPARPDRDRRAPVAPGRRARRSPTCSRRCAIPTAASTRPRTPTRPTPTATASRGCSTPGHPTRHALALVVDARRRDRRGARLVRDHRRRQLRRGHGTLHPQPAVSTRPTGAAPAHRSALAGSCSPPAAQSPPARPRRQGADRMERVVPLVARRGRRGARTAATGSTRRSPTPSS